MRQTQIDWSYWNDSGQNIDDILAVIVLKKS